MDAVLKWLETAFPKPVAIYETLRREYEALNAYIEAVLHRPWRVADLLEIYLIYSTIASLFMGFMLTHIGVDIFYGYPIVIVNTVILIALNRLVIHRNHAIFMGALLLVSLIAARHSGTPVFAIVQQVVGILVFSIYYISMLTTFGLTVPRWLETYTNVALIFTVWAIIDYVGRTLHIFEQTADPRLKGFFHEPSFFVYITLPAIGLYLNAHLRKGWYWLELAIFLVAYVLADSSLGYLGLLCVAFFAFLPRFNFWRLLAFFMLAAGAMAALFFLSTNFRLRARDTFVAIVLQDLRHANASTFAVLANAYVTVMTFIHNPLIGVGIGGYSGAYNQFLSVLNKQNANITGLNSLDASSLFLRTTAELGLFGIISLFGFLILCSRVRGDVHVDIRNAIIPFFLLRMGRYGAYFSMDLYFFVGLYFLNYMHYRHQLRATRPLPPPAALAV